MTILNTLKMITVILHIDWMFLNDRDRDVFRHVWRYREKYLREAREGNNTPL